ncbi:MAG: class I SAM-dependent methyltransferase [Candidatus Thermoplasmatota archaeon]
MKKEIESAMLEENIDYLAKYYDLLYEEEIGKDYEKESKQIIQIIEEDIDKEAEILLDVGCGTGSHLKYLCEKFRSTGVDKSEKMVKTAKKKVPDVSLEVGDMVDFELDKNFDVIICLFGTIGFAKTYSGLVKTLENFKAHLSSEGIVIIEPWIYLSDFEDRDKPHVTTAESDDVLLVRMEQSEIKDSKWILNFHYLVGEKGEIHYSKEVHEMLALDRSDYVKAFEEAGFEIVNCIEEGERWVGARELLVLRVNE